MNNDDPSSNESRFVSLSEVKQTHAALRKRFSVAVKSDDEGASMADEIERFVERGRATGTVLAESDVRWSCQTILDYWLTKLYDLDRDDVDTTLADFDPETAPELPDELCPYMGLDAFHEEDAGIFFGEKFTRCKTRQQIGGASNAPDYRTSGSGKSSLILAGLIPALKSGALPGSDGWNYPAPMVPGEDPVANLQKLIASAPAPRVVVVDQFEELFTLNVARGAEAMSSLPQCFWSWPPRETG